MKNKSFWVILIVSAITMVGCADQGIPDRSGETLNNSIGATIHNIPSDSQEILNKTISALVDVKTCTITSDVLDKYTSLSGPNAGTSPTEWMGIKSIDFSNKQLEITMDILDQINWGFKMYVQGDWEYFKGTTPGLYKPGNPWDKTIISDKLWAAETQIPFYLELLKTAVQSDPPASEKMDGVDCFVLNMTPATTAIIDWVISQEQPVGPQLDMMFGGAVSIIRADAYISGSMKLWIDKTNFLPLKAQINADFNGYVGGGPISVGSSTVPATNPVDSNFTAQIIFSDYGQPVAIQIPTEALQAQAH